MKLLLTLILTLFGMSTHAEVLILSPQPITEWKAVFGVVETRNRVPARARIGGTIQSLDVSEGDIVTAGQRIALITDSKLEFQLEAMDSQIQTLGTRLATAQTDFERGEELFERGVITKQRFDQLTTQVNVLKGEIRTLDSNRQVIAQRVTDGEVLAPEAGVVLSVPTSKGAVANPGEGIAIIGGGGVFLRLSVPERHASTLVEGEIIEIGDGNTGKLVKVFPQIQGGRVLADVEVTNLNDRFIGRRIPVRLPVRERHALIVPQSALELRGGIDFATIQIDGAPLRRSVVLGSKLTRDGQVWYEILTGLNAGDKLVTNHD